jgi:hypothetical protein
MNNIIEVIPKLRNIIDKIESIKNKVIHNSTVAYDSQDARMVALDSIQIEISAIVMWITSFLSLGNKCTYNHVFDEPEFLRNVCSQLGIEKTEEIMFNCLRLGFITLVHFKIDNLFYNILRHLNNSEPKKGYTNRVNRLVSECSITDKDAAKKTLFALASMRNTLHNNGIHRGESLFIKLGPFNLDFKSGQYIECAGWNHIVIILEMNIDVLGEILMSKPIVNIKTEIKDDYSSAIKK